MAGADLIPYQAQENDGLEYEGVMSELPESLETHGPHAFVIAPERFTEVAQTLAYEIPGGELREYTNERLDAPLVYVYYVNVP
jgi:hypothetical protein